MLVRLLIAWLVVAAAIGLAAALLDSVTVQGGLASLLWVSVVFALVTSVFEAVLGLVLDKMRPSAS